MDLVLLVGVAWEKDLQTMSTKWSGNAQGIRHSLNIKTTHFLVRFSFQDRFVGFFSLHTFALLCLGERLNGKF